MQLNNPVAYVDANAGGASYLVYTASLSQSGTDAPVAVIRENTLGGSVTWAHAGDGQYEATLPSAATDTDHIIVFVTQGGDGDVAVINASAISATVVRMKVYDDAWTTVDNRLRPGSSIEIRVYP